MKDMKKWLEGLYSQLTDKGLTNPDEKPPSVPCGTCSSDLDFEWKSQGQFNYWVKKKCAVCDERKRVEKKNQRISKTLKRAGVPPGLWGASLDSLYPIDSRNEEIARRVANWNSPSWLMSVGPVGTGKTTWLTSLFNQTILSHRKWDGSLWTTESSLFERADVAHELGGYTARQASVAPYIRSPLLLLDDIGASRRRLTEWQGSTMRNLFDVRYSNGLPTFMTSNIESPRELTSRYGSHVYSRIASATGSVIRLLGEDRRLNG